MKIRYVLPLLALLMMSFSSASVETMKPAELNQEYIIVQTCTSCTYVNFSLTNKDGTILENQAMTSNGSGNWVYTFTPVQVGRHDISGTGDLDGTDTSFASYFEVTPSGYTGTLGFYFLIIILSIGVMLLGFYVQDATIVILGSLGLYFVGIYILFYGIDILKDTVYTWGLGIITLMIAAYISVKAAAEGYLS